MKIILPLFLFFSLLTSYGQEAYRSHSVGLSISNGLSWPFGNIKEIIKPNYGIAASVHYQIKFKKAFALESGIEYSNLHYRMEEPSRWNSDEDGIIGFDTWFLPRDNNEHLLWNPNLPWFITDWIQEKRTGFLSVYLKPHFYLPTKRVGMYLFIGASLEVAIHQFTESYISEKNYGDWKDNFREVLITKESVNEIASVGFFSGLGFEKELNQKIIINAELSNKIFSLLKFHKKEYSDWDVNYCSIKIGLLYSFKQKKSNGD